MTGSARWDDLGPRAVSGVAIAVVGIGALVAGDPWLSALAAAAGGVMIWELSAMTAPGRPREAQAMGLLAAIVLAALFLTVWEIFGAVFRTELREAPPLVVIDAAEPQ